MVVRRLHDLTELRALLREVDAARSDERDLEDLNPWALEGRDPADVADMQPDELKAVLAAARRVVDTVAVAGPR